MEQQMSGERRPRILVIEDERGMRNLLSRILHYQGYDVELAQNGKEALAILHTGRRIEIIIADLIMPELSGLSMVTLIRLDFPRVGLVVISGKLLTINESEQLSQLNIPFIAKPFSNEDVVSTVDKLIQSALPRTSSHNFLEKKCDG